MTTRRLTLLLLIPALALLLLGGLLAGPLARLFRPVPNLAEVRAAMQAGRYDLAEAKLDDFLFAFPRNVEARLLLAQIEVDRDPPRPDRALAAVEGLKSNDPRHQAEALFLRGRARLAQDRYDEAEEDWKAAL